MESFYVCFVLWVQRLTQSRFTNRSKVIAANQPWEMWVQFNCFNQTNKDNRNVTITKTKERVFDVVLTCNAPTDGSSDATAAIQNCTNLATENGGILYFPPLSFVVTSTIKVNSPVLSHIFFYLVFLNAILRNIWVLVWNTNTNKKTTKGR